METNQSHAVMSTLAVNTDWPEVDYGPLEDRLKNDSKGLGRDFKRFLQAGGRMPLLDLCIATAPFNVKTFCGQAWELLKDDQDKKSAALREVNFKAADFLANLEGDEKVIGGEEKLKRLRKTGRTLYGATVFMGVWANWLANKENPANSFLEKLYQERGITRMYFFGDVLLYPGGGRDVLCVYRYGDGSWDWRHHWLDNDFYAGNLAVVSPQV